MNAFDRPGADNPPAGPPKCPACRSGAVTTTAKKPDANSYWRCERCGEIWNVGRHDNPRAVPWR